MALASTIKKSFKSVADNPAITLLLVIFLIGANILGAYILSAQSKLIGLLLIFCLFAFVCIFVSGWFKVVVESCDLEKIKEKKFYAIFLEGIGENIIGITFGAIIYSIIILLTIFISQKIALLTFGSIDFFFNDLNSITQNNTTLVDYFATLSPEQKAIVYGWNICILCGVSIFNFVFLFYYPALIFEKTKNQFLRPIIAVWKNLVFLFKNFFGVLVISILIHLIHMFLAYLNTHFAQNMVLSVVFLLIYIYFVATVIVLLFNYYDKKTNCNNGTDCLREDELNNQVSKET